MTTSLPTYIRVGRSHYVPQIGFLFSAVITIIIISLSDYVSWPLEAVQIFPYFILYGILYILQSMPVTNNDSGTT
jgi:hypothetical protein